MMGKYLISAAIAVVLVVVLLAVCGRVNGTDES